MRKIRTLMLGVATGLLMREIPKWLKTRKELKEPAPTDRMEAWVELDDDHLAKLAHDQEKAGLRIFTGGEDIDIADAKVVGDLIPHGPQPGDPQTEEWIASRADQLGISRSEMRRRAFRGFLEQDA